MPAQLAQPKKLARLSKSLSRPWVDSFLLLVLLGLYTSNVLWSALTHGPRAMNEVAHLASGIVHWRHGSFVPYRVNPPLVRLVASIPALEHPGAKALPPIDVIRPEYELSDRLLEATGPDLLRLIGQARLAVFPLVLPAIIVAYRWGRTLSGRAGGLMAAVLVAVSPAFLNASALILPDGAASSLALCAMYAWYRWSQTPTGSRAIFAGCLLGFAVLSKSTLVLLGPIVISLVVLVTIRAASGSRRRRFGAGLAGLGIALLVLNAGYGFQGGTTLARMYFRSQMFQRGVSFLEENDALRWILHLPIPLPRDFVLGIDEQQLDFEKRGTWTYCFGRWYFRGPWYAYAYLVGAKEPLLHLAAALAALGLLIFRRPSPAELLCLWLPGLLVVAVASVKCSLVYLRYVLPGLIFFYVGAGATLGAIRCRLCKLACVSGVVWTLWTLWTVAPHWEAYANELVGGPANAYRYLPSNQALGRLQDAPMAVNWLRKHQGLVLDGILPPSSSVWGKLYPELSDLPRPPIGPSGPYFSGYRTERLPLPGTYLVWLPHTIQPDASWAYFRYVPPKVRITPTVGIYTLTREDVERLIRTLSIPAVSRPSATGGFRCPTFQHVNGSQPQSAWLNSGATSHRATLPDIP